MNRKTTGNISAVLGMLISISILIALFSCAGSPDAKTTVMEQNRIRSYERFLDDHSINDDDELEEAGIHYDGRNIYVVISLSDSGADRYPEWACDKLTTTLYGYRAVDQTQVSDDEYYELVLKFTLEDIVEGKYENLARIRIDEKDVESFIEHYQEDF